MEEKETDPLVRKQIVNTVRIGGNSLSLTGYGLTEVPTAIRELTQLQRLDLSRNSLTEVPSWLGELTQLQELHLWSNSLTEVPAAIRELTQLKLLHLSSNLLTEMPSWLGELTQLQELHLWSNSLTEVPAAIRELTQLKLLHLSSNLLTEVPSWLGGLVQLKMLDLSINSLMEVPTAIRELTQLQVLLLSSNALTEVPSWLGELAQLEVLDLSINSLTEVSSWLGQLKQLRLLDLSSNLLTEVPSWLGELAQLDVLDLRNNPIENPPLEIAERGLEAIRDYFRQLEDKGEGRIFEAKLLIVGEPGAGKTSLAKKLESPEYELQTEGSSDPEVSTEGIDITQWTFEMEDGTPFRLNIWDFGGQEIYHATHQFFLTKRSLYALVADSRKENTDFFYWLDVVALLSDESPVFIVKNEKQDRVRDIPEAQPRREFLNLKDVVPLNLATNRGLDTLRHHVKHFVQQLPHVGDKLPSTWVRVRERLEEEIRPYLSLQDYTSVCAEYGFESEKDALRLSEYLHDLGVCLHFQDNPVLRNTVILQPEWGTDAVYRILDDSGVRKNRGRFTYEDAAEIWSEPDYSGKHADLLQLMMKFKLCYPVPGTEHTYIAPQLLPQDPPKYDWDESDNLRLRYRYTFMPKGIVQRLIVELHHLIEEQQLVWKNGVVFQREGARAEVMERYNHRELRVRVAGPNRRDLLVIIIGELEKIHASYNRLEFDKLIPCNCSECSVSTEPHFFAYDSLQRRIRAGKDTIECDKTFEEVMVGRLIYDLGLAPGWVFGFSSATEQWKNALEERAAFGLRVRREAAMLSNAGGIHAENVFIGTQERVDVKREAPLPAEVANPAPVIPEEKWWKSWEAEAVFAGVAVSVITLVLLALPSDWWLAKVVVSAGALTTGTLLLRNPQRRYWRFFKGVFWAWAGYNLLPGLQLFYGEADEGGFFRVLDIFIEEADVWINLAFVAVMCVLLLLDYKQHNQ